MFISACSFFTRPHERLSSEKKGVYHVVERGQTLYRIAKTYNVDINEIAQINDIRDPSQIKVGYRLFIPGATKILKVEPYKPGTVEPKVVLKFEKGIFVWPLKGEVISYFGMRNGKNHDGIDIQASSGTAVKAAADGKVLFSSSPLRGYGNVVILEHGEGYTTVYAHNEANLVKEGDFVKKNDAIARVGSSGNATVPHLHFEIRYKTVPKNPIFYLP